MKKTHKVCGICGKNKPVNEFYKNGKNKKKSDGYRPYCRLCDAEYRRKLYDRCRSRGYSRGTQLKFKEQWIALIKDKFGLFCHDCGYTGPFDVFDFHHIGQKNKRLSEMLRLKPTEERIKELDNGVLLCANCHRLRHVGNTGRPIKS